MSTAVLAPPAGWPGLSTECVQDWHEECPYIRCACDCHDTPRVTARQRAILRAIEEHTRAHGYAPSLRELADAIGVKSVDTAAYHVRRMVVLGLVTQAPGKARTLAIPGR
jgi:repressor LexA